ncbi:MAG: polysaccharide deacetylase family protein [Hyphomonas sp.]
MLAALPGARRRYVGRILCYHSLGQKEWGTNDVTPDMFRGHIERALNAGFRFVHASEIAKTGGGPKDLAITFDDGLSTVMTVAAPILKEYGLPWTFFPVSNWAEGIHWMPDNDAFLSWRDIEMLMGQGAEMGSHSVTHSDFGQLNRDQVVNELGGSREMFRQRIGIAPDTFAIPFGQSKNWTAESQAMARDAGYTTIYAQAEETRPQGTVARTFVTRFDGDFIFNALLKGKFDQWEEWV